MVKENLLILFLLFSLNVHGLELISVPPAPSPQPTSQANVPVKCFLSAQELGLNYYKSILLCTNSKTLDPIRCFREVFEPLTNNQKVNLCQGASSAAPQECFKESFSFALSFDQRIKLCGGASFSSSGVTTIDQATTAPAHCFRRSLQFLFLLSQDQKVILCANADSDDPVQCFINADNTGLSSDQKVRLCTQLSPSSW